MAWILLAQDVLGLAKLKFLGDNLNRRGKGRHRGRHAQVGTWQG